MRVVVKEMKVLFLVSNANLRGGTEVLALDLLERLNRAGVEAWLLSRFAYQGMRQVRMLGRIPRQTIEFVRRTSLRRIIRMWRSFL